MLLLFTAFISVWTIFIDYTKFAIELSPVTKRRKHPMIHTKWNTSSSFCFPKAKVMTKIKWEIMPEKFKSYNQIEFSRTLNWSCFSHLRKRIIANIYNFIWIQQGTWIWINIISAYICQLVFFCSTHQHVIFNGYLGVQIPTAL